MSIIIGAMKGIGAAGPGLANLATRAIENDERQRQQAELEAQRRAQREQDLAYQRQTSLMLADARSGGSGGGGSRSGGGGAGPLIEPGSQIEAEIALRKGLSVDEIREGLRTGQITREETVGLAGPTPDGSPLTGTVRKYDAAKSKVLGEIMSELRLGDDYKAVTEGRGNQQRNEVAEGVIAGSMPAADGARVIAATKGEGAFGSGNVDKFTGKADEVGRSVVRENDAQAGAAGKGAKSQEFQGLQQERIAIDTDLERMRKVQSELTDRLGKTFGKAREGVAKEIEELRAKISDTEDRKSDIVSRLSEFTRRQGGRNMGNVKDNAPAPSAPASRPPLSSFLK